MTPRVRVGGVYLDTVGVVGDLEDSTIWRDDGYSGDYELSCTFSAPPDFGAPWFLAGALVELVEGGCVTWSGFLGEPSQGDVWGLTAYGWGADAANYLNGSWPMDANVDDAVTRGMGFSRYGVSLDTATSFGDSMTVAESFDVIAKTAGKVWWVSVGAVSLRTESNGLDWVMAPNSAYLGTTDANLITRLVGLYATALDTDGNPTATAQVAVADAVAAAKFRPHEAMVDLTALGVLTSTVATTYTTARFSRVGARGGYTNGFTVTSLNSADAKTGVPDPMGVRAGQRVRVTGLTDMRTGVTYQASVEVTLGKVRRVHSGRVAICEPVGFVARDFAGALAAAQAPLRQVEVL